MENGRTTAHNNSLIAYVFAGGTISTVPEEEKCHPQFVHPSASLQLNSIDKFEKEDTFTPVDAIYHYKFTMLLYDMNLFSKHKYVM